jgi:hypothetical protein
MQALLKPHAAIVLLDTLLSITNESTREYHAAAHIILAQIMLFTYSTDTQMQHIALNINHLLAHKLKNNAQSCAFLLFNAVEVTELNKRKYEYPFIVSFFTCRATKVMLDDILLFLKIFCNTSMADFMFLYFRKLLLATLQQAKGFPQIQAFALALSAKELAKTGDFKAAIASVSHAQQIGVQYGGPPLIKFAAACAKLCTGACV